MSSETKTELETEDAPAPKPPVPPKLPKEIGGPKGPEPTRYGDWEVKGRCSDF
jgi:hypothetical protein